MCQAHTVVFRQEYISTSYPQLCHTCTVVYLIVDGAEFDCFLRVRGYRDPSL